MRILILLSIILTSCVATVKKKKNQEPEFTLVGKWNVASVLRDGRFSFDSYVSEKDSVYNLFQFFGPSIISEMPGSTIEFTDSNTFSMSILKQENVEKADLNYTFSPEDSLIIFSVQKKDGGKKVYIPTKIDFSYSKMIFKVDEYFEIKLNRQ